MKDYQFDPSEYGYESVEQFPELKDIVGSTSFVKVIAISNEPDSPITYWYSTCQKITSNDDRWRFRSSSYQESSDNDSGHVKYVGTITSKEYVEILLPHLFGTTKNSGVEDHGIKRMEQRINHLRLTKGEA